MPDLVEELSKRQQERSEGYSYNRWHAPSPEAEYDLSLAIERIQVLEERLADNEAQSSQPEAPDAEWPLEDSEDWTGRERYMASRLGGAPAGLVGAALNTLDRLEEENERLRSDWRAYASRWAEEAERDAEKVMALLRERNDLFFKAEKERDTLLWLHAEAQDQGHWNTMKAQEWQLRCEDAESRLDRARKTTGDV